MPYLKYTQRVVTALQQLSERWLRSATDVLVNRLQCLDRTGQGARFHDTNESPPKANPGLKEGYVGGYPLCALETSQWVHGIERVQRERDDLSLCNCM